MRCGLACQVENAATFPSNPNLLYVHTLNSPFGLVSLTLSIFRPICKFVTILTSENIKLHSVFLAQPTMHRAPMASSLEQDSWIRNGVALGDGPGELNDVIPEGWHALCMFSNVQSHTQKYFFFSHSFAPLLTFYDYKLSKSHPEPCGPLRSSWGLYMILLQIIFHSSCTLTCPLR